MSDPLDWKHPDLAYLKKHISEGNVVLFLGAGFSSDATNIGRGNPPLGSALAKLLATDACLPFHGEPLPLVYAAAVKTMGDGPLRERLRRLYEIESFADWYKVVRTTTWYRIYTTNIDDLMQRCYADRPKGVQELDTIVCPEEYRPRREDFREVQCVHLHGSIRYPAKPLTFSAEDFATHTARPNPWYQSLADDLYDRPVLFVGTQLGDAPFYHYLQLRKVSGRQGGRPPKSVLVTTGVSPIQRRSLEELNLFTLDCAASEFFESLNATLSPPERSVEAVVARVSPTVVSIEDNLGRSTTLSQHFLAVIPGKLPRSRTAYASMFLLGAEPTWDDIEQARDAEREITRSLTDTLRRQDRDFSSVVLHGPAGSGKSSTMMRAALAMAQDGHIVLYAKNEGRIDLSDVGDLAKALAQRDRRLYVFIDGFTQQLGALLDSKASVANSKNLCLVLSDRTNAFTSRYKAISLLAPTEMAMPDLTTRDAESIIDKLESIGLLGELRGKSRSAQVALFMEHAARQLLVAMREATSGRRFDLILKDELDQLDEDAQLAYVMCALAVAQGAPGVYRRHLMPALGRTKRRKAVIFDEALRGVLVPANGSGTLLRPRHRLIAHLIARDLSRTELRFEAVVALLIELSGDITPGEIVRRSPAYLAYRGLINADGLFELFGGEGMKAIKVYESVRKAYDADFLFWVHYGMAYVRIGNLDIAENFIRQSLAIREQNNFQAMNQLGIVYLMQAANSPNPGSMVDRATEGLNILRDQIVHRGDSESHPYGAFMTYVSRWYLTAKDLIPDRDWETLRSIAKEARAKYPFDDVIREADKEVGRSYLLRHVKQ